MKKNLIITGLLVALTSSSLAASENNSWFVGSEVGKSSTKANLKGDYADYLNGTKTDEGTFTEKYKYKPTFASFKIGKYFEYGRIYTLIGKEFKTKNNTDVAYDYSAQNYLLGYDYLFENKSDFTPFIGINAGYTRVKFSGEEADSLVKKANGLSYGVNIGTTYALTNKIDLEIGGRYLKHNIDKSFKSTYDAGNGRTEVDQGKVTVDDTTQYFVGISYKF